MAVILTGGEVSDVKGYAPVMAEPGPEPKVLMGDKGYDADAILADLQARGVAAVIPPKRNRKVQPIIDGHLYALRNLVERCFSKLKHSRRLATRYDKTADSYLGFILAHPHDYGSGLRQQNLARTIVDRYSSMTTNAESTRCGMTWEPSLQTGRG